MNVPITRATALAQNRIAQLASCLPVHRAFHWLHLHQPQLLLWQQEMVAIPAPPFGESERAAWFTAQFVALGLAEVHRDAEGNVLGEFRAASAEGDADGPVVLIAAHLDTVFPAGTNVVPRVEGSRILAPGICDNGAGLTALLGLAAALRFAQIAAPATILFVANVGEEGAGDLRGMRHLFERGRYAGRIASALLLEGAGTAAVVTRALGSRRFRVEVTGPGGHSWADAGALNPIVLLSRGITQMMDQFEDVAQGPDERSTLGPGVIEGGTSVNSIPASAFCLLDLRSTHAEALERFTRLIERVFAGLETEGAAVRVEVRRIGERPAAALAPGSALLETVRAVDRHLGIRTEPRLGSTDANLPLALGIPAVALAAGGTGGGIHTLAEWFDPTGRELALRRILLTLLDVAQTLAFSL